MKKLIILLLVSGSLGAQDYYSMTYQEFFSLKKVQRKIRWWKPVNRKLLNASIFHATNRERDRHNRGILKYDKKVHKLAKYHSKWMKRTGIIGHSFRHDKEQDENVAWDGGFWFMYSNMTYEEVAQDITEGWNYHRGLPDVYIEPKVKETHYDAMMDKSLRKLGCSYVIKRRWLFNFSSEGFCSQGFSQ